MSPKPSIYVASPFGFSIATRMYYEQELLVRLATAGFEILDPWSGAAGTPEVPVDIERIGRANAGMIDRAAALLAVLDGPDVDSGTAAEIGYAAARGTPVVGLRTDLRQTGEEGATVNLQVEYFIRASGGEVAGSLDEALGLLGHLLEGV